MSSSLKTLCEFQLAFSPGQRMLGLDLGDKTIGVAASDPLWQLAMPVETIRRTKFAADAERLALLIREREIGGLVIGLPISLNGTEGPRCQSVRQFGRNLAKRGVGLPTLFWDERMSTAAVERMMIHEGDVSRARRAEIIDAHAAAYILQGALDALANLKQNSKL